MANIEDFPGFESFGADVKAAPESKALVPPRPGGDRQHR